MADKKLGKRSAGDVLSRQKKLYALMDNPANYSFEELQNLLEQMSFDSKITHSAYLALLRSEKLYREFQKSKRLT